MPQGHGSNPNSMKLLSSVSIGDVAEFLLISVPAEVLNYLH